MIIAVSVVISNKREWFPIQGVVEISSGCLVPQKPEIDTVCVHNRLSRLVRKLIGISRIYSWVFSTHGVYKVCLFMSLYDITSCRFTLSTSGPSIAALICAFYPRFPISSTDNR